MSRDFNKTCTKCGKHLEDVPINMDRLSPTLREQVRLGLCDECFTEYLLEKEEKKE